MNSIANEQLIFIVAGIALVVWSVFGQMTGNHLYLLDRTDAEIDQPWESRTELRNEVNTSTSFSFSFFHSVIIFGGISSFLYGIGKLPTAFSLFYFGLGFPATLWAIHSIRSGTNTADNPLDLTPEQMELLRAKEEDD